MKKSELVQLIKECLLEVSDSREIDIDVRHWLESKDEKFFIGDFAFPEDIVILSMRDLKIPPNKKNRVKEIVEEWMATNL